MTTDQATTKNDVMTRLKEGTREQHEALHGVVSEHHMTRSLADYARCLRAYERSVEPIESALKSFVRDRVTSGDAPLGSAIGLEDLDDRLVKTDWLRSDLNHLRPLIDPDQWCERLQTPTLSIQPIDWDQWFGQAYVAEGMSLGARFIAPEVEKTLSLRNGGLRFFRAYGEQTSMMWNRFRKAACEHVTDHDAAVRSAQETFRWFAQYLSVSGLG